MRVENKMAYFVLEKQNYMEKIPKTKTPQLRVNN
jgi:hypothetical protein